MSLSHIWHLRFSLALFGHNVVVVILSSSERGLPNHKGWHLCSALLFRSPLVLTTVMVALVLNLCAGSFFFRGVGVRVGGTGISSRTALPPISLALLLH